MTDASPIFCFVSMEKDLIIKSIEPAVNQRGCFIVDVSLSRDNDIVLTVEKEVGEMDLEDCVAINDAFLAIFDKDAEALLIIGVSIMWIWIMMPACVTRLTVTSTAVSA